MFNDPYCSIAEADSVNTSSEWDFLTDDEKTLALKWGRLFLDSNYSCISDDGTEEFTNALKLANSLLGQYHAKSNLFNVSDNPQEALLTDKTVKAGSVEIGKKYTTGAAKYPKSFDKYPDVTAALSKYCSKQSANFVIRNTVRR